MNIETKTVKLSSIKQNPDNPRQISAKDMERLVKSLTDFPEMLELREIVVDETHTVLGGNMRLLALRKIGAKECTAKIVKGLTPEQKREFIIKDNGQWGQWDFDALANGWDELPLAEWGIRFAKGDDPNQEWSGMPEFEQEDLLAKKSIKVNFLTEGAVIEFADLIQQTLTMKTRSIWFPEQAPEDRTGVEITDEP